MRIKRIALDLHDVIVDSTIIRAYFISYCSIRAFFLFCVFFLLQTFGIGSVAQTVLSRGENGTFFTINFCWGIGVTLGIYWAGGISGEELSSVLSLAPSTLIRFQTKTELFCSVSKKDFRSHLSFSYRFARPHYNAVSVFKTLLYPQYACPNELDACDACAFQYIGPRNWREIDATWLHIVHLRKKHSTLCRFLPLYSSHGSAFPPFWILTVEWSGARSCRCLF